MANPTVDELIAVAKQALDDLQAKLHESIDASIEHQAVAEEYTHEAQQITEREEP